jgi:outer membrane protein TolC
MIQMNLRRVCRTKIALSLLILLLGVQHVYARPLTLQQAENAALSQSPEMKALQAKTDALGQSAVAAGQLSDPKLMLGAMNVPVDTFDFSQEPMTQVQVGLMQAFPRGRSLHYRLMQKKDLSVAESRKLKAMRLQVLQGVRLSWLNLYYWVHAKRVVLKQKKVFRHLVKVTESMLGNNKAQQKDVIRAQLELTELDNRLLNINQQIKTARATLGRWIGAVLAKRVTPRRLPTWSLPPKLPQFHHIIKQHPILKTDAAFISSGEAGVQLAKQQYKPGFSLGVAYGFRQGCDINGRRRPDFLTAQISMDLPLFRHNRQDRTLRASQSKLLANEKNQMSHYRQLLEVLKTQYAAWQQQRKSAWLYRSHLVPEAKQYAESTMTAYQNTQTDFPTLARAYVRELNTELDGLRTNVHREIARANLLYLQGK